jgi:hypothetical protein
MLLHYTPLQGIILDREVLQLGKCIKRMRAVSSSCAVRSVPLAFFAKRKIHAIMRSILQYELLRGVDGGRPSVDS